MTVARNEADNLVRLASSLLRQTRSPAEWIIVDTGSDDGTLEVARKLAASHPWVHVELGAHAADFRRGGRIARAVEIGASALCEPVPDVVIKVDADVSMASDHFDRLLTAFEQEPALGIASGSRFECRRGRWRQQFVTGTAVEAQVRAYRWACFQAVTPFEERIGWDGIDEIQANLRGWSTRVIGDLPFLHHRAIGAREARRWQVWKDQGESSYYLGYRPIYLVLRALHRMRWDPAAFAMVLRYVSLAIARGRRHPNPAVRAYVRRQQRARRLPERVGEAFGRRSTWRRRASGSARAELLLVCQPGGHLAELLELREVWQHRRRAWITLRSPDSVAVLAEERVFFGFGPTPRSVSRLILNAAVAARVLARVRPRWVLTTGAAIAVPVAWLGRVFGCRTIYVECGGRVGPPSLSMRLIAPIAHAVYVQWPDQAGLSRRAQFQGRILRPRLVANCGERSGPIVATVGTTPYPFDRFVKLVDEFAATTPVFLQSGFSTRLSAHARQVKFLSPKQLADACADAPTVITHGGVGSVALAWRAGHRPIVVPRRHALGENVDDHQVAFVKRLEELGFVDVAEDVSTLSDLAHTRRDYACATGPDADELVNEISSVLERTK